MRGNYWRMIREDAAQTPLTANGVNRQIRIEGIPLRIDNRDTAVLALASHTRAIITVGGEVPVDLTAREAQMLMHGSILLPGRNSVGLVPTSVDADAIGVLNTGHVTGNTIMRAGFQSPGGIIGELDNLTPDEYELESTLILPYAPRSLSAERDGTAGAFDGAIDSALFDLSPPTLSIGGLGQLPPGLENVTVNSIQTEVWVCLATCEPGEAIAPSRPIIGLLGEVNENPKHYGLGEVSDVQVIAILARDRHEAKDLPIWASPAHAAIELDGTEICESPWRSLLRQVVQEAIAGSSWRYLYELDTALLLTPASLPKASERHKGSRISIEGYSADMEKAYAVGYWISAPEPEVLSTWAAARSVDLSTARVHGSKIAALELDDRRFVGISPIYSRSPR